MYLRQQAVREFKHEPSHDDTTSAFRSIENSVKLLKREGKWYGKFLRKLVMKTTLVTE